MRVLTKSRFKLGLECPNKLFYTKKDKYVNQKIDDTFLQALAQGGFQVEELARMHYPEGVLIEGNDWDYVGLAAQTQTLLLQENVIIFEAAFLMDNLFIRTDVLVKQRNQIQLIEVKAKSFNPSNEYTFIGKRGGLVTGWKPYLFDVAFQKYVMQLAHPEWSITSKFMLANKESTASIDGLNQLFRISKQADNRTGILKLESDITKLGTSVLGQVDISHIVAAIMIDKHKYHDNMGFVESINLLKAAYLEDRYFNWPTSYRACKSCEFKTTEAMGQEGKLSGFKTCFKRQHLWGDKDFEMPNTFDIWDFRRGEKLFSEGIVFKKDVTPEAIGYKEVTGKLSRTERQWIQIEKDVNEDGSSYVDVDGLKQEMNSWVYPLHFIDFETSTVALPFNKGRRPYEQIAFQFSHHIYYEDGTVEHATEYVNNEAGVFPNFEFIRQLKHALEKDKGTIFRFAAHENTIVNAIYEQLLDSDEVDKQELIDFVQSISHSKNDSVKKWKGERDMDDLCEVIKKYYYNPHTKGSNSIKMVLPAVLKSSKFLKDKYSQSIGDIRVSSKNFDANHVWLQVEEGEVKSPYKLLPKVYEDWTEEQIEQSLSEIEDVSDGGGALAAYGKLQYTNMSNHEREQLTKSLLKYCELDTLAMVMIFEHFKEDLVK
ncbi:conserved protein of unknown function [Tenacibaculum sp. 190130A14a]|uniref:DUF2779 domain-containing protein n=1 Tax=Tenacibaculum polynesiense TaxID=3137857 RepID=A0ABP1F0G1_9FLAO